DNAGVGDKRRPGQDLAAVFFDDQHLIEGEFGARIAGGAIQGRDAAWRHLDLMAAGLNYCGHNRHLCKRDSLLPKSLRCKGLAINRSVTVTPQPVRTYCG